MCHWHIICLHVNVMSSASQSMDTVQASILTGEGVLTHHIASLANSVAQVVQQEQSSVSSQRNLVLVELQRLVVKNNILEVNTSTLRKASPLVALSAVTCEEHVVLSVPRGRLANQSTSLLNLTALLLFYSDSFHFI